VAQPEGSRSQPDTAPSANVPSSHVSPEALALVRRRLRDQLRERVERAGSQPRRAPSGGFGFVRGPCCC
jgi:hypothetical protein